MIYQKALAAITLAGLMGVTPLVTAQDAVRERPMVDRTDREHDRPTNALRLRCGSTGMEDVGMRAHYIRYRERGIAFGAQFGAESAGRYHAGDVLDVYLAGIAIGEITLERLDTEELVGRIALRYQPHEDPAHTDVDLKRYEVRQGTSVVVGALGCALSS